MTKAATPHDAKPDCGTPVKPDWSLGASGCTYLDRNEETSTILNRLRHSTSSVTGIAGRRGAGKSSLAIRILHECEDEEYFTLLVQSPTSYDPREFLIAISQRTCDAIIERMDARRGQRISIENRAQMEERRLKYMLNLVRVLVGALTFALVVFLTIMAIKQIVDSNISFLDNRISEQVTMISNTSSNLTSSINTFLGTRSPPEASIPSSEMRAVPNIRSRLTGFLNELQSPSSLNPSSVQNVILILSNFLRFYPSTPEQKEENERTLAQIHDSLFELRGSLRELHALQAERKEAPKFPGVKNYLIYFVLSAFLFGVLVIVIQPIIRHLNRQLRLLREEDGRKVAGLRSEALRLAERLAYETTVSTSHETGVSMVPMVRMSSAFRRAKSLTTHPVSLPGLTETYSNFLKDIGDLYPKGIVICFDELDKIDDPKDLDMLLRGVKGILGRPDTHFLFTVSDDAVARFSTRRVKEQGILESAFEDIVLLDRIGFRLAEQILAPMFRTENKDSIGDALVVSTKLFWLFGGGVPREIKRYARACLEAQSATDEWEPIVVWRKLLGMRFQDIKSFVSRIGRNDETTAQFLSLLYDSEGALEKEASCNREWFQNMAREWLDKVPQLGPASGAGQGHAGGWTVQDGSIVNEKSLLFGRAAIELILGATGVVILDRYRKDDQFEKLAPRLMSIFEHAPSNFVFAWNSLSLYIEELESC